MPTNQQLADKNGGGVISDSSNTSDNNGSSARRTQSRAIFISASDTGVGKTLISGLLLNFLLANGHNAAYQKWVATGCEDGIPEDLATVARLSGLDMNDTRLSLPFRFKLPASPHLAAAVEGKRLDIEQICKTYHQTSSERQPLLVEGVGGLMVPLVEELLLVDLLARLSIPVLLVVRSGLGTINHSLMSMEALASRGIELVGVIMSDEAAGLNRVIVEDNYRIIEKHSKEKLLGRLPWCHDDKEAIANFMPIAREGERRGLW